MYSWTRIARRIRVPAGFVFAAFYLWRARPSWVSLAAGAAIVASGLALRAYASGYLRKASELTTTGPYAYTRNPLYLGSLIMAAGFAVAARSFWIALAMAAIFLAIYVPVMNFEEQFLRSQFPGFDEYAQRIPRLLPRISARPGPRGQFSLDLYRKHREYNAALGAAAILAALIFKLVW
ncbi:MAG: isoprenylcysteine carboxylmethyltransferase family protein [Terriglobales bacterium]